MAKQRKLPIRRRSAVPASAPGPVTAVTSDTIRLTPLAHRNATRPTDAYDRQALWDRITAFAFSADDEQLTFAQRLARENGWTLAYAERVIGEYRRFMYLAVVAGHPVTPSDQVDQVWHLHLAYTRSYWEEWCGEVLRKPIHHGPTKGGAAEDRKFRDWYNQTRDSYYALFKELPPKDIWPYADERFHDTDFQRVNMQRYWLIPKPPLALNNSTVAILVMLAIVAGIGFTVFNSVVSYIVGAWVVIFGFSYVLSRMSNATQSTGSGKSSGGGCGGGCGASGCGGGGCGSG